jgi:tRNA G18 (ribose-2'-O)-methylase SpoU
MPPLCCGTALAGVLAKNLLPLAFLNSPCMDLLLYAPEYRPNMSSMIRSAEFFGFKRIYIYDQNKLLTPPDNKKGRANMEHMARVWTAGAVNHIEIILLEDPLDFLQNYAGRKVGTLVNEQAQHLNAFSWQAEDLILFGSEKDGLPEEIIQVLDATVYIPSFGQTDCLNVAVSFGIVVEKAMQHHQR